MANTIIIIAGPTASGKTAEAIKTAMQYNGIVINADSVQTYNDIPILSAQPTIDEIQQIPHKLFGYLNYTQSPNVVDWCTLAANEIKQALSQDKTPIIVGGTGLYINKLVYGISEIPQIPADIRAKVQTLAKTNYKSLYNSLLRHDPMLQIKSENHYQVLRAYEVMLYTGQSIRTFFEGNTKVFLQDIKIVPKLLIPNRHTLYQNINLRFLQMIKNGAIEEVQKLLQYPNIQSYNIFNCIGVKELSLYISGEIALDDAILLAQQRSRNYAKRQITWFKNQWKF